MEINAPPADLHDAGHDLADNARDTVPPWPFAFHADSDDPEDAADTDGFAAIDPDAIDPDAINAAAYATAAYAAGPPATSAHGAVAGLDDAEDPEDPEDEPGSHLTTPEDRRIAAARAVIMRCRDDGTIARWFGGVASGHLMPLPPALLALAAVATIAHMGLRDLPGLLILAPALIMLVAAPGASHHHDGRLDWLVPAVLLGAQVIYISALGFASGVPAPVTFGLCAMLTVFYADLGSPGSPPLPGRNGRERGSWLGWEGRMLACGLGAAMGIAMFAYLALAVYLAVLVCWKITTGYSGFREGDCR